MSDYIVSARKYRPTSFDAVVGQKALTTTLKNAIAGGKLAHAYLFCGPRGVGKTTSARIFAKTINCLNPTPTGEACDACESCVAFNEGRSYNIHELDAASNNSVDDIRELIEQVQIPPQVGRYKVFIIDEVHMLSTAAFNAFLKTLEEPPAHVIFILATTEKHKILPTILSRCQIYDFERMTVGNTIEHLKLVAAKESITYDEEALAVIAEKADGGMRDALSIFDQAASFCQGNITYQKVIEDLNVLDSDNYFKIIDYALANKVSEIMVLLNGILNKGFDGGNLIGGLAAHVRNVLMARDVQTLPLLETSQQQREKYHEQSKKCPVNFLYQALKLLNQCDINYKQSSNKRLLVEITLIQVAQITQPDDDDAGAGRSPKRLKSLFKKLINSQPKKATLQVVAAEKHTLSPRERATQAVTEPAVTPSVTATSAATTTQQPTSKPRPSASLDAIGFTFRGLRAQNERSEEKKDEQFDVDTTKEKGFTQDQLETSWYAMLVRMPQSLRGLATRLKNVTPRITEFPKIEIVVDNQILLTQVEPIKLRIKATLAKELNNGQINVEWRVAQGTEVKPLLTKRESFEEMKKENPALAKLCQVLHLDMS